MALQDILTQAVTDVSAYQDADNKLTVDKQVITDDQAVVQAAASKAQVSVQAGIAALTAALSGLPAIQVTADPPAPSDPTGGGGGSNGTTTGG